MFQPGNLHVESIRLEDILSGDPRLVVNLCQGEIGVSACGRELVETQSEQFLPLFGEELIADVRKK